MVPRPPQDPISDEGTDRRLRQPGLRLRSPQNLLFGVFLVAAGALGLVAAWDLPMGRALRMGPGYMPKVLSGLLLAFGVGIAASSLAIDGSRLGRWAWRPMLIVLGAVALFGFAIERLGLVATTLAVVLVSTLAAPDRRWREAVVFAALLAFGCVMIFRLLLRLPLPVWPL
jgi:putative tricarboxylic transport membrane protein